MATSPRPALPRFFLWLLPLSLVLQVAAIGDGNYIAVEYTGGPGWVVGVQWHPERMPDDALAQALFTEFVAAGERARNARDLVGHKA